MENIALPALELPSLSMPGTCFFVELGWLYPTNWAFTLTNTDSSNFHKMAIHEALHQFGQPPLELCLDWAWQIRHLQPPQSLQSASATGVQAAQSVAGVSGGFIDHDCDWSQLTLDNMGCIAWNCSATITSQALDSMRSAWLAQLHLWCESSALADGTVDTTATALLSDVCDRPPLTLEQRTLAWLQSLRPVAHHRDRESSKTIQSTSPTSRGSAASQIVPNTRPRNFQRGNALPLKRSGRLARNAQRRVKYGAIAITCVAILLVANMAFHERSSSTNLAAIQSANLATTDGKTAYRSSDAENSAGGLAVLAGAQDAVKFASGSTDRNNNSPPILPANFSLSMASEQPSPDEDSVSQASPTDLASEVERAVSLPPWNDRATESRVDDPLSTNVETVLSSDERSTSNTDSNFASVSNRDVLAEMSELSKSASGDVVEQIVSNNGTPDWTIGAPPLLLDTFPMMQVQRFDKLQRPRQPSWRLQLIGGEGLEVSPRQEQILSEELLVSWEIRAAVPGDSEELKSFVRNVQSSAVATVVIIQTELVGKRDPSLRWRIFARNERYPHLALPLERRWLDRIQDHLGQTINTMQLESERLREMSRAGGLPSPTRSLVLSQSRAMANERKLAKELLDVVAEANQLVGWLDGQIAVKAELVDSAAPDSTALLQFGVP